MGAHCRIDMYYFILQIICLTFNYKKYELKCEIGKKLAKKYLKIWLK